MKHFFILLAIIACPIILLGQQLPTIVPPSPQAQAFMRYGEIPVDYSTGVPSISIPLYTVKGNKLVLPINISYHASGIKVNDIATEVGLGWVLNCGGIVSRTVFGIPDERNPIKAFSSASQLHDSAIAASNIFNQSCKCLDGIYSFEELLNNSESGQDYMSDRFNYNLPNGISGVFRFDYLNTNSVITLPYKPLKIEKILNTPQPGEYTKIMSFKITDPNGVVYIFETFLNNTPQYYSEWYLKKMISADATDMIEFFYSPQAPNTSAIQIESHILMGPVKDRDNTNCFPDGGSLSSTLLPSISQSSSFNTPVLDSIVSSNAIIKFTYQNDRSDFSQLKRLSGITISPTISRSNIIKSINFNPKYFGSVADNNIRLGLDYVTISAPGNAQPHKYAFNYENQVLPPYPSKMTIPRYNEDFWGYYNGSNAPTLIPSDFISDISGMNNLGANRYANLDLSRACMLKEIKYPTGGRTVFQFERNFAPNVYPYNSNPAGYIGGFRIGTITSYNEINEAIGVKAYEYSEEVVKQITKEDFMDFQRKASSSTKTGPEGDAWSTTCWVTYSNDMLFSNPVLPLEVGTGLPIMYTKVIEYNGTKTNNAGKTVFEYNLPYSACDFETNNEHPSMYELRSYYHPFHYDKGNFVPELISKTEYSFGGMNYHPVSKEKNEYTKLYTTEFQTGIKLNRTIQYQQGYFGMSFPTLGTTPAALAALQSMRDIYTGSVIPIDTKAYQEASLLTDAKNYTFDPLDSTKYIVINTDYTYNGNNLETKEKSTYSSIGDLLKMSYKYPLDFPSTTITNTCEITRQACLATAVTTRDQRLAICNAIPNNESAKATCISACMSTYNYDVAQCQSNFASCNSIATSDQQIITEMQNKNMINVVIEEQNSQTKNTTTSLTGGIINKFKKENGLIVPSEKYSLDLNNPSSDLTASSINASGALVFHPNFSKKLTYDKYDAKGNILQYHLSDNTNTSFIWSYSGSIPVIKCDNVTYDILNAAVIAAGATNLETFFSGLNNIATDAAQQTTWKNFNTALRSNASLANAQITTYTYKPLVGMTSQTDPNGITTYFEYDSFGRLKNVKDKDQNILKSNLYHYYNN